MINNSWKSKTHKYGIKQHICGVYKITNKITGDFYIGSSVNVAARCGNHMGRDAKRYPDKKFYQDVKKYRYWNFDFEVIEMCKRDELIEREAYWYDTLHPTYNEVRPTECNFVYDSVRQKSLMKSNDEEHVKRRKELYNSDEYQDYFRHVHVEKMKPCIRLDKNTLEELEEYISYQEAARWVLDNTEYKSKNATSKIREVCLGTRNTAFGYKWKLKEIKEENKIA